jgi:hypothetical protein
VLNNGNLDWIAAFLTTGPPTDRNDHVWAPHIRAQIWRLGGIG